MTAPVLRTSLPVARSDGIQIDAELGAVAARSRSKNHAAIAGPFKCRSWHTRREVIDQDDPDREPSVPWQVLGEPSRTPSTTQAHFFALLPQSYEGVDVNPSDFPGNVMP